MSEIRWLRPSEDSSDPRISLASATPGIGIWGMLKFPYICFFCLLLLSATVSAQEDNKLNVPQITLSDFYFQPEIRAIEGGKGGMDPLSWTLTAKTNFASWVDLQVSVGATPLLYRPTWAPSQSLGPVAVIDALATLHSLIGDIYAGQSLVPWGLEGQTKESQLWLPRDLLFENGAFPLRDVGVGIKTEINGFYMNLMAHNGEGGDSGDQDNRMFVTSQWGFYGPANSTFGISATAGRVSVPLVVNEEHVRGGNLFFGFNIFGLGLQTEGSYLQYISAPQTVDTFAWHIDLEHPITDHINFIGRYEQYNPNTRVTSNIQTRAYAGGEYHSKDNSSRLFLFAVQNALSQSSVPGNQIQLAWRLSPP